MTHSRWFFLKENWDTKSICEHKGREKEKKIVIYSQPSNHLES